MELRHDEGANDGTSAKTNKNGAVQGRSAADFFSHCRHHRIERHGETAVSGHEPNDDE